jgi:hypothetical protein
MAENRPPVWWRATRLDSWTNGSQCSFQNKHVQKRFTFFKHATWESNGLYNENKHQSRKKF